MGCTGKRSAKKRPPVAGGSSQTIGGEPSKKLTNLVNSFLNSGF